MIDRLKQWVLGLAIPMLLVIGCDEVPTSPDVPDRLRVALVTASRPTSGGTEWLIYEIDQEGTIEEIVRSNEPILEARYTSYLGNRGSIAYMRLDSNLIARHLESGDENVIEGPFNRPRFSLDGLRIAHTRVVVSSDGTPNEQVFVLDRASGDQIQITIDECQPDGSVPEPCAFASSRPIFGEDNELYMIRKLRSETGARQVALSVVTTNLIENRYMLIPDGAQEIYPNTFFEGTLVAGYTEEESTPDEVRGFYAVRARTGDRIDNEIPMRDVSFCYDATIVGIDGSALRFVDIPGEDIDRVSLPDDHQPISVDCSFQSKDLFR